MLMQISCGCCGTPGTCGRPLYGGTALNSNSEVSGYTTNWQSYFSPSAYVTVYGYKAQITSSDYTGTSGGQYHYEVKMRPFRWLAGGGTDDNNYVSDMVISKDCENRFTGPPSNCHLGSVSSSGLTYSVPAVAIAGNGVTYTVEYSRAVVDSADASGIFAESGTHLDRYIPFTESTLMTEKDIYIECWIKILASTGTLVTTPRDALWVADISYPPGVDDAVGKLSFTGGNIRSAVPAGSVVRLTFDANGPAGLSSLDLEPQSGWSFANVDGHITMVHASTGDQIDFLMQNEVPRIYIKLPAETYPVMTSSCVYYPRGTEYESVYKYQPTGLFVSVWTMPQRGSWIPSASQDFHIEGRLLTNWDRRDYGVYKPEPYLDSAGFTDAMYTNFPRVVAVELV